MITTYAKAFRIAKITSAGDIWFFLPTVPVSQEKLRSLELFKQPYFPLTGVGNFLASTKMLFDNHTLEAVSDKSTCVGTPIKVSDNLDNVKIGTDIGVSYIQRSSGNIGSKYFGSCPTKEAVNTKMQEMAQDVSNANKILEDIEEDVKKTPPIKITDSANPGRDYLNKFTIPNTYDTTLGTPQLLYEILFCLYEMRNLNDIYTQDFPEKIYELHHNKLQEFKRKLSNYTTDDLLYEDCKNSIEKLEALLKDASAISGYTDNIDRAHSLVDNSNPDDDYVEEVLGQQTLLDYSMNGVQGYGDEFDFS